MKKILQIIFSVLALLFILCVPKVLADTSTSKSIDWNAEKAKALAAGYSEKEFEAWKSVPYLPPEEDISKFYDNLQDDEQNNTIKSLSVQERVVEEAKKTTRKTLWLCNSSTTIYM